MSKDFVSRVIRMLVSVIIMGVSVAFLSMTNLGTDPWAAINYGVSGITGISFGTCQLAFNIILFIVILFFDKSLLGLGTFGNMILVGYAADFTTWIMGKFFGIAQFEDMLQRVLVMIPALLVFVLCAGIYMNCNLGTAPYDALCNLIYKRLCRAKGKKLKFRIVRMCYDGAMTLIGFLIGGGAGVVTVGMVFTLGPMVDFVGHVFNKKKRYN